MERFLELTKTVYIVETDKDFNEGSNIEYYEPYRRTKQVFYSLPEGSTLYLEMSNVRYVDWFFALLTVGEIQNAKATGTHADTVYRKHLVVKEPSPLVLDAITKMVDDYGNCFLHLDSDGVLNIGGRKVNNSEGKLTLLNWLLSKEIKGVSAEGTRDNIFPQKSVEAVSHLLRELAYCGLLVAKDQKLPGAGRPQKLYSPFWPDEAKAWRVADVIHKWADV